MLVDNKNGLLVCFRLKNMRDMRVVPLPLPTPSAALCDLPRHHHLVHGGGGADFDPRWISKHRLVY